jgi:(1->4)-alpha-D-glucan 1-alpha-D-glucosylmutase
VPDARLADLASRCNIDLGYHDVWGKWHDAPERTLRLLLTALGIRAGDDAAVECSLREFERDRWQLTLPAAIVIQRDALVRGARIQLRSSLDGRELAWRVTEENGRAHGGKFMPEALQVLEEGSADGESFRAVLLPLPGDLSFGYHRIALFDQNKRIAESALIVVPARCYQPEAIAGGGRVWGGALQLYGLRSERNWGIGDFTDLRLYIDQWAARGASLIGVNPLHALFLHNPAHVSPYSPSSRLFLNVLYLDVEAIEDFRTATAARELANSVAFRAELKRLRDAELVDYVAVAAAKRPVLEMLYAHFNQHELRAQTRRARAFRKYRDGAGIALRRYALFEALQEYMHREQPGIGGWQQWPEAFRDPRSSAVDEFAQQYASRVEFFEYLQWQADEQMAAAEALCFERGLGIGLYTDLAISIDRSGADAWANQDVYALSASVGAPPDAFNIPGQNWGLPPLVPTRLREAAYAPLIATLRGKHDARRRAAHRSCDGTCAALLGAPGRRAGTGHVRSLSVRGHPWHRCARKPPASLPRDRRGSRDSSGRGKDCVARRRCAVVSPAHFRAR